MTSSSNIPAAPVFTSDNAERIRAVFPAEMIERPQWVAYLMLWMDKKGKFTKKPIDPNNGRAARSNDPTTWGTFEQAVEIAVRRKLGGVGFVFNKADPYCGIDIDDAVEDDGRWKGETQEIIAELNSYTERSPSGKGCHIIGRGVLPPGRRRRGGIEMYDHARFFTVTGIVDGPGVLREFQDELDAFHARIFDRRNIKIAETRRDFDAIPFPALSDAEVVETASQDPERGEQFAALWRGQWRELGYPSPSEADLALCSRIAYYVNFDPVRVDAVFRQSGLFRPEKWDRNHHADGRTYGQGTVDKAVSDRGDQKGYKPGERKSGPPLQTSLDGRITITVNRQLNKVLADAWTLVNFVNNQPGGPRLFQRAGAIVRIRQDDGAPYIAPMSKEALTTFLYENADWISWGEKSFKASKPQAEIVAGMLTYPNASLPRLIGISGVPFLSSDGKLITVDGYHRRDCIWLKVSDDLKQMHLPEKPSKTDSVAAVSFLCEELLVDFPFAAPSDRAHALAALLLPFVRPMIQGATPLHLIEAPTPGSGKTLFANLIGLIATGEDLAAQTLPHEEEEIRKRLTTILRRAPTLVLLDNVSQKARVDSGALCAVITASEWSDRLLGVNEDINARNRAIWLMTANNPRMSLEVASRTIRIRIDPRSEEPWERQGFRHEDIRSWTREYRRELVEALLTLIAGWIEEGQPFQGRRLGRFEQWTTVVGGILQNAGVEGFLANRKELYRQVDDESSALREFVEEWWQAFSEHPVTVKDLLGLCAEKDLMTHLRTDNSERSHQIRLGRALKSAQDRVINGCQMRSAYAKNASGNRVAGYQLVKDGQVNEIQLFGEGDSPDGEQSAPF